jgi:hypothetical protein
MQAYRIHKTVIAADIAEEAGEFYRREIGGVLPDVIEELPYLMEVCCDDGTVKTIKTRINEELDARNSWLIMGIPCEPTGPFSSEPCHDESSRILTLPSNRTPRSECGICSGEGQQDILDCESFRYSVIDDAG